MNAWQHLAGHDSLNLHAIQQASELLADYVVPTPVLSSPALNELTGAKLHFKCENLQRTGAFKFRGACHALLQLPKERRQAGVYTVSSGNHGAALACAGQLLGIKVEVAVPTNAPAVKKANIHRYGAHVTEIEPGMTARDNILQYWQETSRGTFIPPYDHPHIIAGQGTAALELFKARPDLDVLLAPVGGGGLLAGTAMVGRSQELRVYGAEPSRVDDAWASLQSGQIEPARGARSICDGLLTSLGQHTFPVLQRYLESILRVPESAIVAAMELIWQELKVVVEPSSATVLAALQEYPEIFQGQQVGLILSGGNLDVRQLPWTTQLLEWQS